MDIVFRFLLSLDYSALIVALSYVLLILVVIKFFPIVRSIRIGLLIPLAWLTYFYTLETFNLLTSDVVKTFYFRVGLITLNTSIFLVSVVLKSRIDKGLSIHE